MLRNMGQIREANLAFGDLTVLVGPQASGKSIALQWLKLVLDDGQVQHKLQQHGLHWDKSAAKFLNLYFGEGMSSIWGEGSEVRWNHHTWDIQKRAARKARGKDESVYLIPAQRVLTLRDGWPRPFSDFSAGDPFSVRWFGDKLSLLMQQEAASGEAVFPRIRRLKGEYRRLLEQTIFGSFQLSVDRDRPQKRLVLARTGDGQPLPYMVWSAGQREFVPLLLGLYWLMPPAKAPRRGEIQWVIIEEPEMGMHPRAISTLLLFILELLHRGYRVCISTHSPQVLDLVWVLQILRETRAKPEELLRVLGTPKSPGLLDVAAQSLKKTCKVYYFEGEAEGGGVGDITGLDPSALDKMEASWGGLLEFSGRANEAVAAAMAGAGGGSSK
jgi:hypothetical protein